MHTWAYMLNCERPPTIESFLYLRVSAEAHALLKGLQGSGLHVDNNGPRVTVRTDQPGSVEASATGSLLAGAPIEAPQR